MPRWGPDADGKLYRSAMQLILERGYDQVTVAEIAEHAGLTKRSFFRHYADKREVVFAGSADFQREVVDALQASPAGAPPLDAVLAALLRGGLLITAIGEPARRLQHVIAGSAELRERDLIKLDALTATLADTLRGRGVGDPTAALAARLGVAAFTVAFRRWVEAESDDLPALVADTRARLGAVVASG